MLYGIESSEQVKGDPETGLAIVIIATAAIVETVAAAIDDRCVDGLHPLYVVPPINLKSKLKLHGNVELSLHNSY